MNVRGMAILALVGSLLAACGDDETTCEGDACCEETGANCCVGEGCVPADPHGVAVPWETLGTENGPAAAGTLMLKLTSANGACVEPWVSDLGCEEGDWEADIPLPPALQFAGATVDLADLADLGGATVRKPFSADDCTVISDELTGTLEIVSIDETSVELRLTGASVPLPELEAGAIVPRCQNPDLPQPAVAMTKTLLETIYAPKIAGGGEDALPEPIVEELHVFIDQTDPIMGATCMDPLALLGGCDAGRATLQLVFDPDHQVPGSFEIGAGVIASDRSATAGPNGCEATQTPWTSGTVEILAISPNLVHVRTTNPEGVVIDAIATRCY